jgi:hypothetical protein
METQYIKISDTEFKEVVPVASVATIDDLINLREAAAKRVRCEQDTVDALDLKITAVKAIGVKTAEEIAPDPVEEPVEEPTEE